MEEVEFRKSPCGSSKTPQLFFFSSQIEEVKCEKKAKTAAEMQTQRRVCAK